jgi:hypothetical protein
MPQVDPALSVHYVKKLQTTNELTQQPAPTPASTKNIKRALGVGLR